MYQYGNKKKLPNLHAEAKNETLTFKTLTEEVLVKLSETGRIKSVTHRDLVTDSATEINDDQAHHIVVGEGNCQRDVYHYLLPSPHAHLQLRLGQTEHRGEGTWSSLPHDFENHPEPGFEELFFYILSGGNQKAIQVGRGLWADGSEVDTHWLVNNRVFGTVPMGYHPVVGEPGVNVSYVWAYLAKKKEWEKVSL